MILAQNESRGGLPKIRSVYSYLAPAEQKVASYVLENCQNVIYMSVTQLAEAVGVGESTVIRFCQNAGFSGYQELKLILARDLVEPDDHISEGITSTDSLAVMAKKVGYANAKALKETFKILDLEQLQTAITAISDARKVEFYGVGASGVTAMDAKYRFLRLGILCDALTDSHMQAMAAMTLQPSDVAIGISYSGSTKDVVGSLVKAKERGAKVICITAYGRSPIAKISDVKLISAATETPLGSGSLRSKIAQLHILDLLYTGVALRLGAQGQYYNELTAKAVLDKLY